jgi:hypothetical protein
VYATLGRSDDRGKTWTDINEGVLDFSGAPGAHYDAYVQDLGAWSGRLHLTWTIAEGDHHDGARRNVYHAYYDPETGHMYAISGIDLGRSITWDEAIKRCIVVNTGDAQLSDTGSRGGDSVRGMNHRYDPEVDTGYIATAYADDGDNKGEVHLFTYRGITDGSGEWEESRLLGEQDSPRAFVRINNNNGWPQVMDDQGIWTAQADESYEYTTVNRGRIRAGHPVQNGQNEFAWYGWEPFKLSTHRPAYAIGYGISGSATWPRPPRNLRIIEQNGRNVTIDWNEGLAGPSGLKRYDVYVDGERELSQTETPNSDAVYPRTWADINLNDGSHEIAVTLITRDGEESQRSNTVSISL